MTTKMLETFTKMTDIASHGQNTATFQHNTWSLGGLAVLGLF